MKVFEEKIEKVDDKVEDAKKHLRFEDISEEQATKYKQLFGTWKDTIKTA